MVADAFLDTIPFPLIVIFIILAAVMIRFMTAGSVFLLREQKRVSSSSASSMNFKKPVVFDDGFHPVEGFQVNNHRLFLVFCIREYFRGIAVLTDQ
jgi:hypothetical protein